ncbi:MAG: hypothetical protein ACI9JN_002660 [Bacteroidia bacterium]
MRYCKGEPFVGVEDKFGTPNALTMNQTPKQICVASTTNSNEFIEIEIFNVLGVSLYSKRFYTIDIKLVKYQILPKNGTFICFVRQGNHESRMKIVYY